MVLFVPSVERNGTTPIDQDLWVNSALELLGRRLGREAKQGEVGLVVGDEYFAIRGFEEV